MRPALFCLAVSLSLVACADQTGVLVRISSTDIAAPSEIDGLTIRAYTPDGLMVDQSFAIRSSWPQSLLIRPASGEALGDLRVDVTGTLGGAFVVRRVVMTTFMPGQVRNVDVQLTRDCVGVMCSGDHDCVAGTCQGEMTFPDAGVDAGLDGGVDAAMDDGGSDAGDDASNDGGMDANTPCAGASCVDHVVISELSTYMSNEFVELYNRGGTSADLGGCTLDYAMGASWATRATLPAGTTLASHGYYLLANAGYSGSPAPDLPSAWTLGFLDADAAIRIRCDGVTIDTLGYGASAVQHEGTPTPAIDAASLATSSYERKAVADSNPTTMASGGRDALGGNGYDSGDNAADFVIRAARDPQSSASPHEP